jgi:hypothetical protein
MQMYIRLSILASTLLLVLTACGGGGGSGEEANIDIQQGFGPNDTSSHALQTAAIHISRYTIRTTNPGTFVLAVSYADFDLDGDIDVFMSSGDGSQTPTPSELYLNDGAGNFTLDTSFFNGSPPGQVHPRKALTGDYNGDGKMDMFVIGHGYDKPPFPGEAPYVILSSPSGYVLGSGLDSFIGFQHGGSSADIDNDNDIDVFVTDTTQPFFLVNDGFGNFTRDVAKIPDLGGGGIYTAELVDVDKDGFVDLLVSGHEHQGFSSQVLWGDNTGV